MFEDECCDVSFSNKTPQYSVGVRKNKQVCKSSVIEGGILLPYFYCAVQQISVLFFLSSIVLNSDVAAHIFFLHHGRLNTF